MLTQWPRQIGEPIKGRFAIMGGISSGALEATKDLIHVLWYHITLIYYLMNDPLPGGYPRYPFKEDSIFDQVGWLTYSVFIQTAMHHWTDHLENEEKARAVQKATS